MTLRPVEPFLFPFLLGSGYSRTGAIAIGEKDVIAVLSAQFANVGKFVNDGFHILFRLEGYVEHAGWHLVRCGAGLELGQGTQCSSQCSNRGQFAMIQDHCGYSMRQSQSCLRYGMFGLWSIVLVYNHSRTYA